MKQPEDVRLSREEGEALIERIERNALSAEDRRVLVKILTFYFWLLFALREAKLSLKRLKALVFGGSRRSPRLLRRAGRPAAGVRAGTKRRREPHMAGQCQLPRRRPRRNRPRLGTGGRAPRCIA
jgi:hypothetical protein